VPDSTVPQRCLNNRNVKNYICLCVKCFKYTFFAFILSVLSSVTDQLPVIWHQYYNHLVTFKDTDISADILVDFFKKDAMTVLYLINFAACFRFIAYVCTFQVPAIQLS
jgi:hypothetical protein